jgi:predicted porin
MAMDAAVRDVGGKIDDHEAVLKALKNPSFKSVRGDFKYGANNFPVQNYYLREVGKDAEGRLTNKLVSNSDARLIAVGYEHPMSKRTTLYGTYAKMNNDTLAAKTMLGGVAVAAGFDPSAWQFGLKHAF